MKKTGVEPLVALVNASRYQNHHRLSAAEGKIILVGNYNLTEEIAKMRILVHKFKCRRKITFLYVLPVDFNLSPCFYPTNLTGNPV
jgi:hypothetical protein